MSNNYCVYMHRNKINKKVYIGITKDIQSRWACNGIHYKPPKEKEGKRPFWNAICKYGWDNFEHIILFDNLSKEEAEQLEIELIKKYNARDREFGYNVAKGGEGGEIYIEHPRGMLGKTHSDEYKQMLSERMSGENNPFYGKNWEDYGGHPRGMLGKHHTEEHKQKLSERMSGENNPNFGKPLTDEQKQKLREEHSIKVICITTMKIFNSEKEGAEYYKCDRSGIGRCCRGYRIKNGKKIKCNYCGKLEDGTKLQWKYLVDYLAEQE